MSKTTIEWASHTWNPYLWRCNKVSDGCKNCYMFAQAERYGQVPVLLKDQPMPTRWPKALAELKKFPSGAVVFVNSMSDTFHPNASQKDIHRVFNTALVRPDVTFLVLTKRPERAYYMRHQLVWPKNLWMGVSIESNEYLWRADYLLELPAAGHFVSAEPLLTELSGLKSFLKTGMCKSSQFLPRYTYGDRFTSGTIQIVAAPVYRQRRIEWIIVGGESGKDRRAFQTSWARELRDLCIEHDVAFMYKQGSAFKSGQNRLLDGKTWDGVPAFGTHQNAPKTVPSVQLLMEAGK